MPLEITEGWTAPIDYQLLDDGVAVDHTGFTVALILKDAFGGAPSTTSTGEVAYLTSTDAKVRYQPSSGDLRASRSPYTARFKVTDGAGKIAFYPQGAAERWDVIAP